MADELIEYTSLLDDIKTRIRRAQTRAVLSVNLEMLALYWEIGAIIVSRQRTEGWGAGVLRRLALDLKSELSGVKGFSERNLKRMTQFHRTYPDLFEIGPPAMAPLRDNESHARKRPPVVAQLDGTGDRALAVIAEELRQLVSQLP